MSKKLSEQTNEFFDVVFTTNREKDLKYLAVAGRSLLQNCSQPERVRFHILYTLLDEAQIQRINDSWKDLASSVNFYSIENRLGELARDPGYGYWYRIYLGDVLPSSISKALYLDTDVVVHGDIAELWNLQLDGKVAGVVWDPGYRYFGIAEQLQTQARKNALNFPGEGPYFNTGFLLIDLRLWRSRDIPGQVEQHFGDRHQDSVLHDQDELNIILQGQVLALSPTWNLIEPIALIENWDFDIYRDLADPKTYFTPKIRHFSGASKADSALVRSTEKANFYRFLDKTDWAGWRSVSDSKWWAKPLSEMVELHYILVRGLRQRVMTCPLARLRKHLQRAPYTALLYLGLPLYRLYRKIRDHFP